MVNPAINLDPMAPTKDVHSSAGPATISDVRGSLEGNGDALVSDKLSSKENTRTGCEIEESRNLEVLLQRNLTIENEPGETERERISSREIAAPVVVEVKELDSPSGSSREEDESKSPPEQLTGSGEPTESSELCTVSKSIRSHLLSFETSISTLCLSNTRLTCLPDDLERFANLSKIDLSNNELSSLPSLAKLNKLQVVNLSSNKFVNPPQCLFCGLYLVRELDLSHNQLEMFNMPPLCLPFLKILKLNDNILRTPPHWLYRDIPSSVHYLDLSNNPWLTVGLNISYFPLVPQSVSSKISELNISNCGLADSNIGFLSHFSSLKKLYIGNKSSLQKEKNVAGKNIFHDFPMGTLGLCRLLTDVHLQNLSISGIQKNISSYENLQVLNIVNNELNWLPSSLCLLEKLKVFKASNCGLYFLPEEFGSMGSLKELYLNENWLSALPENFQQLYNLEVLDLYKNNFTEMPVLSGLKSIKALDVYMNYFEPPQDIVIGGKTWVLKLLKEPLIEGVEAEDPGLHRVEKRRFNAEPIVDGIDEGGNYFSSESSIEELPGSSGDEEVNSSDNENWDTEVHCDDNFDPTVPGFMYRTSSSSDESLKSVPFFLKGDSHFFVPYKKQLQFWGTVNPVYCQSPVEGQFDDV